MDNKNGQHHSPIAVLPRQKATGTHRDRGWMGPRTGLGAFEKKKKISYLLSYLLTPWSRILLEKVTGSQLVKKFLHFMEPEGSLPQSQVPSNFPYPEPARSSPYTHILLPEDPS